MNSTRRLWLIVAFTMLAFAIRVYRLDTFALRGDESFTVQFSYLPAAELFEGIRSVEPNPPLYYYALRGWMALAGQGDFAPRFFSLFFGVLLVPLLYVLGRSLVDKRVGSIAAAISALSPFQIYHSQDVRNYTLWPFLTVLAAWCLWCALRHGRVLDWIGYGVSTLLGLYTHYFSVFVVIADNLFAASLIFWHGWASTAYVLQRWRLLRVWIIVQSVVVIGFLAWLVVGSLHAITSISAGMSPSVLDMLQRTYSALLLGESVPKSQQAWFMLPGLALLMVGVLVMAREKPLSLRWLLLVCLMPLMGVFIASRSRPLFEPRYLNQTAPFLYLLLAQGVTGLWTSRRWRSAAVIGSALWLILAGYTYGQAQFNPRFAKSPDWRARAHYLQVQQQPGDVIIMNYPDPGLSYYYRGAAPLRYVPTGYLDDVRRVETEQIVQGLLRDYQRIWLLPQKDPNWDNDGAVERRLRRSADRIWQGKIAGQNAQLYETPLTFSAHITTWPASFAHNIHLLGYRLASEEVQAGDPLEVVLVWQATQRIPQDFSVFVHLVGLEGMIVAQQDNAPVQGTYPTSSWQPGDIVVDAYEIQLPADLPPGDYTLKVGLYDWMTSLRLNTDEGGDHLALPVRVTVK